MRNMTSDGFHTYSYDAEGNIVSVDGGSTATYVYDALNQRVRTVVGSSIQEFIYNTTGQHVSIWSGSTGSELEGKYYWGANGVGFYGGGTTFFQHRDWLGSERMTTTYNGAVNGTYGNLSFGDQQANTGPDGGYALLDYDAETTTSHAQFRQYNSTQGRWMSPDPYSGSYHWRNPQSFNRYAYALNNPLTLVDPLGLDCEARDGGDNSDDSDCDGSDGSGSGDGGASSDQEASPSGGEDSANGNDPAPPGYSPTGLDPNGNIIYQNTNGDIFVGLPGFDPGGSVLGDLSYFATANVMLLFVPPQQPFTPQQRFLQNQGKPVGPATPAPPLRQTPGPNPMPPPGEVPPAPEIDPTAYYMYFVMQALRALQNMTGSGPIFGPMYLPPQCTGPGGVRLCS